VDARTILRETEPAAASPLAMDQARSLAREISDAVRDPKMHPSIPMKAARAICDRKISAEELTQLLDHICSNRRTIKSTGAYFCSCMKRMFQAAGIQWRW